MITPKIILSEKFAQSVRDYVIHATRAGLAREGKIDKRGRPKSSLQLAVTLRTLNKYGGYDASVPVGVQNFLGATLGRFAELPGYKAVYPQYVNEK